MSLKSIEFNIKSGDYFGTLATVLNLMRQAPDNDKENINTLDNIIKDLMYLQIIKK